MELEHKLKSISLAIQFKSFLLSLDLQSRRVVLINFVNWFSLDCNRITQADNQLYSLVQNIQLLYLNDDEQSKKEQLRNSYYWDQLYEASTSPSFQKFVGFLINVYLPHIDLR